MLEPSMRQRPVDQVNYYGHPNSRPTSTMYSQQARQPQSLQQHHLNHPSYPFQHNRRSPSVNTFSTASSIQPPAAYRKSSNSDLRRSTSGRSAGTVGTNAQSTGYVALLRKQKATVWCDRAQYEDPRLAAQQRAAKQRANLEVTGGQARGSISASGSRNNTGISATGKVAAKIRHHGKTPLVGLTPGENHVGVGGVPLRLSATEVEAESSEDEAQPSRLNHRRTGSSGRSSTASGRRGLAYRTSGGHGSMSSRHSQRWAPGDTPERSGSLAEHQPGQQQAQHAENATEDSTSTKARSTHSGGSEAERADSIADLGNAPRLASNSLLHSALTREKSVKNPEELKRRGSVDERTATLTSQRLYIANPD